MTKKNKTKKKITIKKAIWFVVFTFIISQLISTISDWTIIDPILSKFGPYKIAIEPVPYPQIHGGKAWILTEIRNDGLRTVKNINAEYYLKCEMDSYKKGILHKTTLKKEESDFFEFEAELDTDCSMGTIPYKLKFFRDKYTQKCYINTSGFLISTICMWCEFNVTVYDGFKEIQRLSYHYPFSPGNLTLNVTNRGRGCLDVSNHSNPQNLVYIPESDIGFTIFDFCPGCVRGEITDKEWCNAHCMGVYKNE